MLAANGCTTARMSSVGHPGSGGSERENTISAPLRQVPFDQAVRFRCVSDQEEVEGCRKGSGMEIQEFWLWTSLFDGSMGGISRTGDQPEFLYKDKESF
jgi:hypothetical protein